MSSHRQRAQNTVWLFDGRRTATGTISATGTASTTHASHQAGHWMGMKEVWSILDFLPTRAGSHSSNTHCPYRRACHRLPSQACHPSQAYLPCLPYQGAYLPFHQEAYHHPYRQTRTYRDGSMSASPPPWPRRAETVHSLVDSGDLVLLILVDPLAKVGLDPLVPDLLLGKTGPVLGTGGLLSEDQDDGSRGDRLLGLLRMLHAVTTWRKINKTGWICG